jgi:dTDP-4-dehydrorhamnose reductase
MRVLVTGGAGQLAHDIARRWVRAGDEVLAVSRDRLDVADRDDVLGAVTGWRPDVVVNCAAWTAVDACEGDAERAFAVNALGVRWAREACERTGAHLVQISTDYVFDGTLDRAYREWDPPSPRSVYGASKLGGEHEAGPSATVVRTSWVCGEQGNNMVKTVLRLVDERSSLSFVADQRGCPTFTTDLADAVRRLAVDRRSGVYHVTNDGPVSWYETSSPRRDATPRWCIRSRPPTSTRRGPHPVPPTACWTMRRCGSAGSRRCVTTARRSTSWSPACSADGAVARRVGVVP